MIFRSHSLIGRRVAFDVVRGSTAGRRSTRDELRRLDRRGDQLLDGPIVQRQLERQVGLRPAGERIGAGGRAASRPRRPCPSRRLRRATASAAPAFDRRHGDRFGRRGGFRRLRRPAVRPRPACRRPASRGRLVVGQRQQPHRAGRRQQPARRQVAARLVLRRRLGRLLAAVLRRRFLGRFGRLPSAAASCSAAWPAASPWPSPRSAVGAVKRHRVAGQFVAEHFRQRVA